MPPSTRSEPKARRTVSMWEMPFSTGSTAVRASTAGRMAVTASSRS
jgi:hypothetical protein